ncbi:MAG: CarD family transcriptional regulator, partial [Candidatus Limnocylindrales bacterium]
MTDVAANIRGRRGRDRHIAEAVASGAAQPIRERPPQGFAPVARHHTPNLSPLTAVLASSGSIQSLAERFAKAKGGTATALRHVTYAAIPHGAKTYLSAALSQATGERLVFIARDSEIADRVAEEFVAWLGDASAVVTLEPRTALAFERSELVRDESAARVATLASWHSGRPRVLVASVQALFQRTLPPEALPTETTTLRRGLRIAQDRVLRTLVGLGYESVTEVGGRGEFARRGGIVDIFPAGQPLPVRVEWFGDEIDSLRAFDPADQRGVGAVESTALLPASEFLLPSTVEEATAALTARLGRLAGKLGEKLTSDLETLQHGRLGDAAEIWAGVLAPSTGLDHLADGIWVIDEPATVLEAAESLWGQADERKAELERGGELPKNWPDAYPSARDWKKRLVEARSLSLTWESEADGAPPGGNPFGWREPTLPMSAIGNLGTTIQRWRREGARVVLTSDQSARLSELLNDADIVAAPVADLVEVPPTGGLTLIERSLNGGFAGGPEGVVLVTDRELFGTVRVRRPRALRRVVPRDLLERLQPDDVVVHIDHGVARYAGLIRRGAGGDAGEERDFLELHFAARDRIWVPVEQIDRVTRYAGGEHPELSKLGGGEWQRAKTRVRKAVGDLAKDLLELYSSRAKVRARSFGEDTPWQQEMEAAFPYEETPDQLRAVLEVKADLETERPMDRLVVGDVGYGKTEVAIRAAFKAIQDGHQVAVLVPTTILAAQHLTTFGQRFAAYPITVRMLSRFVPLSE